MNAILKRFKKFSQTEYQEKKSEKCSYPSTSLKCYWNMLKHFHVFYDNEFTTDSKE